ncbi:hypothetical protein Bca52824_063007 [Brassica carinata]|uniref:Uncharacterized protein n=1 Tax=Brassica carinata TaxID=52824 RepID=A0A8X7QFM7_BRACI|nr:hypothetical protein Bca52824_063007 [Brassica carinata]
MKQPATPNAAEETKAEQNQTGAKQKPKKIPTATELISHYQKRGLEPAEASVKVIEDLQNALVRVVSSSKNNASSKDKLLTDARKIDAVNGRLAVVDAKLETKPGYVETFVLGLAGAALNGLTPSGLTLPEASVRFGPPLRVGQIRHRLLKNVGKEYPRLQFFYCFFLSL